MKQAVRLFLVVFVVVAVATKIVLLSIPQETSVMPDGNHIVLFHAEVRCVTCTKMESLIKQVLDEPKYGNLDLVTLEYDKPSNKEFAEQFHIGTTGIILVEQKNGVTVRSCDVSSEAWSHIKNDQDFVEMLQAKLTEFYGQPANL